MTRMRLYAMLALLTAMLAAGCSEAHLSFLDPQGPVAAQQRTHFFLILGIVSIVVLPVLVLTPLLVWRFRYGRGADYSPKWDFSWGVEGLIWVVPILVASILAVLLWINTAELDPWDPVPGAGPPLDVQVVGYDWKWLFIYPELDIATVNELVFPVDRQMDLSLTSDTVMQSFMIPALGGQVYAMGAGMVTKLHLKADGPGRFRGENTQYNGKGFHEQKFEARALSAEDFAGWVADVRRTGRLLDADALSVLQRRSTAREAARTLRADETLPRGVIRFADLPEGLFGDIVEKAAKAAGRGSMTR